MPDLSVIIPAHDVARYLPVTLASLERASAGSFECVLVDDGSTDGTADVAERWRGRLPALHVVCHETAGGPSRSRNTGLARATGRYVAFLDGDDWLAPGYLDELLDWARRLPVAFLRTDHVRVHGRSRHIVPAPESRHGTPLDPAGSIVRSRPDGRLSRADTMVDYPYSWAGVFDRDRLPGGLLEFDPDLTTAEDRDWIWRLHLRAPSYAVVPLRGYFYRRDVPDSLTRIGDCRQIDFFTGLDRVLALAGGAQPRDRLVPKALLTYCAVTLSQLVRSRRLRPEVRRELFRRARERFSTFEREPLREALGAMNPLARTALQTLTGVRP